MAKALSITMLHSLMAVLFVHASPAASEIVGKTVVELQPQYCSNRFGDARCDVEITEIDLKIFSEDDYPSAAERNNEGGASYFEAGINRTTGRVTHCVITLSSGFADLDRGTCKILSQRLKARVRTVFTNAGSDAIFAGRVVWIPSYNYGNNNNVYVPMKIHKP